VADRIGRCLSDAIHEREPSQNWAGSLASGEPWNRPYRYVPAGYGKHLIRLDLTQAASRLVNVDLGASQM
jgi:hypothetical protein